MKASKKKKKSRVPDFLDDSHMKCVAALPVLAENAQINSDSFKFWIKTPDFIPSAIWQNTTLSFNFKSIRQDAKSTQLFIYRSRLRSQES